MLVASLATGCGEQEPATAETLKLTAARDVYAYDPVAANIKGDGNLRQARVPIKMGQTIIAECVYRPAGANGDLADSIKLRDTGQREQMVPLQVFLAKDGKIADTPVPTFDVSPDQIRAELEFCKP